MEPIQEQNSLFGLNIDGTVKNHLAETARWGKFLAIIGFIVCGIIVLAGIFMATSMSRLSTSYRGRYDMYDDGGMMDAMAPTMIVMYLIIGLVYFFPCLFLLRFSNKMKTALATDNQEMLATSFQNLKVLFRYVGIITIIFIALYILAILAVGVGSLA